jgi:rhamnulokinase
MWILKQCLDTWRNSGRPWDFGPLIAAAAECNDFPGVVHVDAPALLLDGDMPARLNEQLTLTGCRTIEDRAGNEPMFARVIFESLAGRYASALRSLENMLGSSIKRIHILGGGSLNKLLTRLTAEKTGLPVEAGNVESSTVGNFAVQCAASESGGGALSRESIRAWAQRLSEKQESEPAHTDPSRAQSKPA